MNFQHSEKNRSCLIFNAQYKSKATIIIQETRIPILEGRNLENEEVLLLSSLLSMAAAYKQITKVTEH